jgi:hypothetical protein
MRVTLFHDKGRGDRVQCKSAPVRGNSCLRNGADVVKQWCFPDYGHDGNKVFKESINLNYW